MLTWLSSPVWYALTPAPSPICSVYETVKRKEAERRADVDSNKDDSFDSFAATLKKQWEERKREMAAANDQSK